MPNYDYECKSCSNTIELSRTIDERDVFLACECGAGMQRLTVPKNVGVSFKGSGFYKTDNPK